MNFSVSWRPKPFYTSKVTRCPNSLQTINLLSSLMSLPRCFADQVSLKLNSTFSYDVNCWGLHPLSFSVKQDHIMLSYGWILSTCLSLSFIICSHPSRMWDKPGPADQLLLSGVGGVSHYRKRSFIHSAKPSSVEIRESQIRSCPTEETHTRHKAAPTHTNKQTHTAADMMHLAFLLLIIFTGKNLCCEHSWWCSCVWRLTLGHYFWFCLRTWSLCLLFCCLLSQSNDAKLKPKMVKVKSQSQNIIGLPALNSFIVLIIVLHLKEEAFLLSGHLWSDKCTEKSILLRVNQLWI